MQKTKPHLAFLHELCGVEIMAYHENEPSVPVVRTGKSYDIAAINMASTTYTIKKETVKQIL